MVNIIDDIVHKYTHKGLWDPMINCEDKALLVNLSEYSEVLNDPTKFNCTASYINNGECNLQGVFIPEYGLFIKEYSPRYFNVLKKGDDNVLTFVQIIPNAKDIVSMGYSAEYISLRNIILNCVNGNTLIKTVSDTHTYYIYHILKRYFSDITSYADFLSRYVGDKGAQLASRKGVGSIIQIEMNKHLKDRTDFSCVAWDVVGEPPAGTGYFAGQIRNIVDITENSQIWLDGGVNLLPA